MKTGRHWLSNPATRRLLGAVLAIALGAGVAGAQVRGDPVPTLTLEEAAAAALHENPSMRRADAGRQAAEARLAEARAGRLPRVGVTERLTNGNNPVYVFGTLLEQGRFGPENLALDALNAPDPLTNFRSSVDVTVPIFDQRQTRTRVEQAQFGVETAGAARELAEERLRFEVLRAYYGVLVAEAEKGVVDEAVASAEADLARITALYDAGQVVASEQMAVDVQLAEFRQQQIQAEGDVATAYAALNTVLGGPVDAPRRLVTSLPERVFDVPALDELMREALAARPDYRELVLELRSREEAVRGAKGEYLPRVDAFASVGASSRRLVDGSADYAVGVSVTFNLFDAGRSARVDQALAAREMADAEREELANAIRLEVVRAYREFSAARGRLSIASRAIAQAEETLRIVRDRHQADLTTITEVLRAQTALVRARMNLVSARYLNAIGYGQVLLATGRLADLGPFTR
jgi:outer membrane protein